MISADGSQRTASGRRPVTKMGRICAGASLLSSMTADATIVFMLGHIIATLRLLITLGHDARWYGH